MDLCEDGDGQERMEDVERGGWDVGLDELERR